MEHKEKYCVYWECRRSGGATCWNWGCKFAGKKCPEDDNCEHWRSCVMCNGVSGRCETRKKVVAEVMKSGE